MSPFDDPFEFEAFDAAGPEPAPARPRCRSRWFTVRGRRRPRR
ncbi:hypothetical protein ACQP2E_23895 [Actinoplanes sp. CA-015351]